jgi:tungstate transport system permease protein
MEFLLEGLWEALRLLAGADAELLGIGATSLVVATAGSVLATAVGLPLGLWCGIAEFRGRRVVATTLNTLLALPTVVVGLIAYALCTRRGLLGPFGLLYARSGMILGEAILAMPIVAALSMAAARSADPRIRLTALGMGATAWQAGWTLALESRRALVAAVTTAFGRLIAEVGIAMMVGGNIRGSTRTMTTAIALETARGEFALGFALGIVLLTVAFGINILVQVLEGRT